MRVSADRFSASIYLGGRHYRQRCVADVDRFQRIERLRRRLRDDRFADMAPWIGRERVLRQGAGRAWINRSDPRIRMRRAQEVEIRLAGRRDIVGEAAAPPSAALFAIEVGARGTSVSALAG